jgi:4-amino-4-deoxy-L-arabinose transferase-like glycosyltransferase
MARPKTSIARQPASTQAEPATPSFPAGFRQGLITAITVLLGFALAFLRYWSFEAAGDWTWHSIVPACIALASIALQLVALFRALRLADDDVHEYAKTVRWFFASVIAMVTWLVVALVESALP